MGSRGIHTEAQDAWLSTSGTRTMLRRRVAAVASKRPLGPRRSPSIPDQPGVWWGWEERGWRLARLHHLIWESKVDDAGPRVL